MEQQNNFSLTLGSLFDGSGGFPLGGILAGIKPVWASEIEPFPVRVTMVRFSNMKHYGDISTLNGAELEPVDIITFGSPCQDMSVAGKRDGLGGSRSSLFYEAIRIIKEMREATNGKCPRYIVWENVPGAFSSNKGEDFKAVLTEICKVKNGKVFIPKPNKWENAGRIMGDGFSIAWRLFDAQYWGVPQRRQRIYLVADFDGGSAGKILFESESLSGYSAQGFQSWQNTACRAAEGFGETGETDSLMFENHSQDSRYTGPLEVSQTILSTFGTGGNNQPFVVQRPKTYDVRFTSDGTRNARQNVYETDTSRTIDTGGNSPDSNQGGVAVVQPRVFGVCGKSSNSMVSDNPHSGFYEADTARTLDGNGGNPTCNQGGIAVIEGNGTRPSHKGDGYKESDVMYTLNATEQHAVAFADVHAALSANDESETDYIVRRLTPTECARLQGFPDWWCDGIGIQDPADEDIARWREIFITHAKALGKATRPKSDSQIRKWLQNPQSDSAEYKMWGNGVALPNVYFVLSGIMYYAQLSAEK